MGWTDVRSAGMTALRRVRAAKGGTVVVLTYHRVAETDDDPLGIAVTPAHFAEHVAAFADRYELMTAGDLMQRLAAGLSLPPRGLCITLDDGYLDALTVALPVLALHDAPATVFACSGLVEGPGRFWWDRLEAAVLRDDRLPERLEIAVGEVRLARDLTPASAAAAQERRRLFDDLRVLIEPLTPAGRDEVLDQLREQTGHEPVVEPERRAMNTEELLLLAGSGRVEIGAHTVNHVRLGALPLDEQRDEIEDSKRRLEDLLDRPVISFSYPHGTPGSFTADTEALVREAGFAGAVTTALGAGLPWGSVSRGTDRFALPRTATADVPAEDLVALIDKRLGL
jgi:peptidoglycan/xylan/chitin deacetylase (PgdA/CDA1 family)